MASYGSLRPSNIRTFQSRGFASPSSIISVGRPQQIIDDQIEHVLTRTRSSAKLASNDAFYEIRLLTDFGLYDKPGHTSDIKSRLRNILLRKDNYQLIKSVLVYPMRSSYVGAKSLEKQLKIIKRSLRVDRNTVFTINKSLNLALPTSELFYASANPKIANQVEQLLSKHTLKPIQLVFN
jgi:hypothetical protein